MSVKMKQKKIKSIHQKLSVFRASDPVISVLMWGVNYSLTQLKNISPRAILLPDDFKAFFKVKVQNHLFDRQNLPDNFKLKEYCPLVFQNLREKFYLTDYQYLESFFKNPPFWDPSESKILITYNRLIVTKAISSYEVAEVHKIMGSYYEHIVNTAGNTLLPHFLFMYRVSINDHDTYMIGMTNVFRPNVAIDLKYCLKGYTYDRVTDKKERKSVSTLKDVGFLKNDMKLIMGHEQRKAFLKTLECDIELLISKNIIDYELLIGVHHKKKGKLVSTNEKIQKDKKNSLSSAARNDSISSFIDENETWYEVESADEKKDFIYFLGILNIFTKYGMKQKTVQTYKVVTMAVDADVSLVKPEIYAKRFFDFILNSIDSPSK